MPVVGTIAPVQADAQTAIRSFLLDLFPTASVVAAQANRVPEPKAKSFVVMTPTRLERLSTNFEKFGDCRVVGSISGQVLTATAVTIGKVIVGNPVDGTGVTAGTSILSQLSGTPGGVGTYKVSVSQNVPSEPLSAGTWIMRAAYRIIVQLDFHSDGSDYTAFTWAQTFGVAYRSDSGVRFFSKIAALTPQNVVVPLHADEPKQIPFLNDAQQYEWRWVLEAHAQINQTVQIPQDYADSVQVGLIPVDNFFKA